MPGARCTRGLVCKMMHELRTRAYRSAETLRHSLRNGFTAYAVLTPATNSFFVTVADGLRFCQTRLGFENLRQLDISNGCQAHTVLPYAASRLRLIMASPENSPVVCTLCPLTNRSPPCDHHTRPTLPRPPQPAPRS